MIRSADDFDVIGKRLAELRAETERQIAADPDAPPAATVPLVIAETASGLGYEMALPEPRSELVSALLAAGAIACDFNGKVYLATGSEIREITSLADLQAAASTREEVFRGSAFADYAGEALTLGPPPLAPDGWATVNDMHDMPVPSGDGDLTASLIAWAEQRSFAQ